MIKVKSIICHFPLQSHKQELQPPNLKAYSTLPFEGRGTLLRMGDVTQQERFYEVAKTVQKRLSQPDPRYL